jgi:hypothetical protein
MKIRIKDIQPNPFRNFTIYPVDEEQVQRLRQSIDELGFFSGVTARPSPRGKGYQLAAGHHRLEAAKREGLTEIEAVIDDYDDDDMVAIMTMENMTQRGTNSGATEDSVAAHARIVSRAILLGDDVSSRFLEPTDDNRTLARTQAIIAAHGPGEDTIYRAINGFDKSKRTERKAENKKAEIVSSTKIGDALATLKQTGVMGVIVSEALADVETIRAERDAARRAEEVRLEKEAEQAEAKRAAAEARAEEERARKEHAAQIAREKAERAKADAAAAEGARKTKAQQAAREAEARNKEAEAARKRAAAAHKAEQERAEKERAKARKAKEERQAKEKAENERRQKEAEAVKAQKELDKVYDPQCVTAFRLLAQAEAFRRAVLSEGGRYVVPVKQQLALAKRIRAEIDREEKLNDREASAQWVSSLVGLEIQKGLGIQRGIEKEEKERLLRRSHTDRVNKYWTDIRRGLQQAEAAFNTIIEEQNTWPYDKALFPIDLDAIRRIGEMLETFSAMKKKFGV